MLQRTLPAGFIAPCLPTKIDKLLSGSQWLHEIKHDGFRVIARYSIEEELSRPLVVGLYASPELIIQIRQNRLLGLSPVNSHHALVRLM